MKIKVKVKAPKIEEIPIQTDFIRLDALLKFAVVTETGGEAKSVILGGLCSLNGEICTQRGRKIRPGDRVEIFNRILKVTDGKDAL